MLLFGWSFLKFISSKILKYIKHSKMGTKRVYVKVVLAVISNFIFERHCYMSEVIKKLNEVQDFSFLSFSSLCVTVCVFSLGSPCLVEY